MFLRRTFDKKTGIYRSKDPIEHFRFKITLKTLHSFVKVPKFNAERLTDADDLDEMEFFNFQWQQKEFSAKEVKRYSNLENCVTDRQKEYHERIANDNRYTEENGIVRSIGSIFSYVNDDNYHEKMSEHSRLAENVETYAEWNNTYGDYADDLLPEDATLEQMQRARYKNLGQFECMYIMADLKEEVPLFTIKYRSYDGLLLIYPDLNNIDTNPYLKEIDSDSRHLYQYAMEKLSADFQNDNWLLKNDIELMANKLSDLCIKSPTLFDSPPKRFACICFYFEIETAVKFEYDSIHINYEIHVPDDCEVSDSGDTASLKGCTHSSRRNNIDGCWLIGYCHELTILCKLDSLFNGSLKITYEVISIDGWERERTEGFAVVNIPFVAGRYHETVHCYRDLDDDTWLNWLERYFIGGRRKVQLKEFSRIVMEEPMLLNRYGNATDSSGQLNIVRNVIIQKNIDEIDANKVEKISKRSERKKLTTISSVLVAYHRARKKLEAIADIKDFDNKKNK